VPYSKALLSAACRRFVLSLAYTRCDLSSSRRPALSRRDDSGYNPMERAPERRARSCGPDECRGELNLGQLSQNVDGLEPCANHRGAGRGGFVFYRTMSGQSPLGITGLGEAKTQFLLRLHPAV
jgi:hypothetical protein